MPMGTGSTSIPALSIVQDRYRGTSLAKVTYRPPSVAVANSPVDHDLYISAIATRAKGHFGLRDPSCNVPALHGASMATGSTRIRA